MDDAEKDLVSLSIVVCGQIAPRVPNEVGCETLYSWCGYANDERRTNMDICLYKRLAIGKHRMTRMYISKENVKQRYMERFRNNNWDESEERDNIEYLDQ